MRTTVVGSHPGGDLRTAVADQLDAGIDLLSDGQTRGDMISSFLCHIPGCARRPDGRWAVAGRLGLPAAPMTVTDWLTATALTATALSAERPVKSILTGPTTLACAVMVEPGAPYAGPGDPALVRDFAAILAAEADALSAAGSSTVQIDEPFFSIGADVAAGLEALSQITGAIAGPWLHCCGDLRSVWPLLQRAPVAVLHLEATRPDRLPPDLRATPALAFGVIDSATDEVDRLETVCNRIRRLPVQAETWLAPDCGLRLRSRTAARRKLAILVQAARLA
ncbi:MAG TPA: hypothetical protein VNT01_05090 [Symbiobacteriaceae bacterium]|nr:hypothetical protein [Symbiobacteriaceae bacterium]